MCPAFYISLSSVSRVDLGSKTSIYPALQKKKGPTENKPRQTTLFRIQDTKESHQLPFTGTICAVICSDTRESSNLINSWFRITECHHFYTSETKFRGSWQSSQICSSALSGFCQDIMIHSKAGSWTRLAEVTVLLICQTRDQEHKHNIKGEVWGFSFVYLLVHKKTKYTLSLFFKLFFREIATRFLKTPYPHGTKLQKLPWNVRVYAGGWPLTDASPAMPSLDVQKLGNREAKALWNRWISHPISPYQLPAHGYWTQDWKSGLGPAQTWSEVRGGWQPCVLSVCRAPNVRYGAWSRHGEGGLRV